MAFHPRSPLVQVFGGAIAMAVAMGIGRFVYTPILPGMMDGLGLSASDAGLIASANYIGYLLGAFGGAGRWAQGREYTVAIGALAASAVLTVLMGMTDATPAFLAIRFLAGIASAFVMIFISTIVFSRLLAAGRGDLQTWHFGGVGLGIALSSLLTGLLVVLDAPWQASWWWSGALSAIGVLVVVLLIRPERQGTVRPAPEPRLPASSAMTRIIIAYGLFGFGYIVTATFLVAIVRHGELGRVFESAVWLVTGLAVIPSIWLWGFAARRWGLAPVFAIGCVVEAVGVVASVMVGGYAGPLIGGLLLGLTFIAVTAFGLQIARGIAGASPRRAVALMTVAFGIGQIGGPIVAGVIADRTGSFTEASLLAAAVLLAAGVVAWQPGKRV